MKNNIKTILACVLCVCIFTSGVWFFGYKNSTVKNQKEHIELTEQPRLEDDFYSHVNYDTLKELKIDENKIDDTWSVLEEYSDIVKDEKRQIIDSIAASREKYKAGSTQEKLCILYDTLMKADSKKNLSELKGYIDRIFKAESIQEYLKAIHEVNHDLPESKIFFPLTINSENKENSVFYPCIDSMIFDYSSNIECYNPIRVLTYDNNAAKFKSADRKILKAFGYSDEDTKKIITDAYSLFEKLSKYSSLDYDKASAYTPLELEQKYPNISFDYIASEAKFLFGDFKKIIVADEAQLQCINDCLTQDNLEALKSYALIRILYGNGGSVSSEITEIIHDLENTLNGETEEFDPSDNTYDSIYRYFSDTVTTEFVKRHDLAAFKPVYTKLINDYIDGYRRRLQEASWLTETTKANALKKLDTMRIYVMYPEQADIRENDYSLEGQSYYEILKNLNSSYCQRIMKDSTQNGAGSQNDWLEVNAFYSPNDNCIFIESGIIYALHSLLNIKQDGDYKYEILGSVGYVIGHELSHAFDNTGAKYDEYGREKDWWDAKDKIEFNRRTVRVEKYYENYRQPGYQTLGENIADLGGYSLTIQLAKGASPSEYKRLFESTALTWASQETGFAKGMLLMNDEHSPSKARVNAVFSSIDKFYEVYNIKPGDGMYVDPKDRVAVW